ncbi:protein kinase domain-containing protein [Ditylenchus destructor]|uniref:non-specific serine/threonine protein kinase n=1 Tax=Ditylenchus destructor TaxID=166010 RepID=A0AAD4MSH3_9BILA|nr:protein kinase domain-containing protein [Ditylenchus destructor]
MPEERSVSRISEEGNNFSRPPSRTENTSQGSERLQSNCRTVPTEFNFNQMRQHRLRFTNATDQLRSSNQPVPGTSGGQSPSPNLSPVPEFSRSSPRIRQSQANVRIPSTSSNFSHVTPHQSGGIALRSTPPMRNSNHLVPETSRAPSYSQNSTRNTPVTEFSRSSPLTFNDDEPVTEYNSSEFYVGYRDPALCPRMMFSNRFDMRKMIVTRAEPHDKMNIRLLDGDNLEIDTLYSMDATNKEGSSEQSSTDSSGYPPYESCQEFTDPIRQGAEARLFRCTFQGKPAIIKQRFTKTYRHPALDKTLNKSRTKAEVKAVKKCQELSVNVPIIYFVNSNKHEIVYEFIDGLTAKDYIEEQRKSANPEKFEKIVRFFGAELGKLISRLHDADVIHGDLTTSNVLLRSTSSSNNDASDNFRSFELVLIDFGLAQTSIKEEDKGVDLYVLERAIRTLHMDVGYVMEEILKNYSDGSTKPEKAKAVLKKLDEVRLRGRKRDMIG